MVQGVGLKRREEVGEDLWEDEDPTLDEELRADKVGELGDPDEKVEEDSRPLDRAGEAGKSSWSSGKFITGGLAGEHDSFEERHVAEPTFPSTQELASSDESTVVLVEASENAGSSIDGIVEVNKVETRLVGTWFPFISVFSGELAPAMTEDLILTQAVA